MKVKMKWSDRVLLALYGCLGIVVTLLIAVGMCTGLELTLMGYRISLGEGVWPMVALAVIAAVLLVWSVQMIRLALRREPSVEKGSVSVQNTENGAVRISVQAMDTLVKQAIGQADGVEEIKTSIVNHEDSISVNIDMTLRSDVHIPNVTMLMQRSIKNFIEEFSGIAVRDVAVLVSRIVESQPPQMTAIQAEPPKAVEAPKAEEVQPVVEIPEEEDGEAAPSDAPEAEAQAAEETQDPAGQAIEYQASEEPEDQAAEETQDPAGQAIEYQESEEPEDRAQAEAEYQAQEETEYEVQTQSEPEEQDERGQADQAAPQGKDIW